MTRKYFGTDGIRGRANTPPMTAEMALKVAMATAIVLREGRGHHKTNRVVIGKDTRLSCYMIEQAMAAGFGAMGMEVIFTGPVPTPGIAMLTRSLRADIGVMISASHNLYMDNGIKLFGADGFKLDDSFEMKIEEKLDQDLNLFLAPSDAIGKSSRLDDVIGRYSEFLKQSFPKGLSLAGMKIVVDCANGAAYKVAPQILWELEAEVVALNVAPNGRNINADCGATDTKILQKTVIDSKADIGIALDGDADRLIMVDEKGEKIDGDQLIAALALSLKARGLLRNNTVAATVMSNLGLERVLAKNGINLERTAVGDRYVMEKMRNLDLSLGGEQSGHIIMSDFGTTGDGMLAALQILAVLKTDAKAASSVLHSFDAVPQILKNVRFESGRTTSASVMDDSAVRLALKQAEDTLANDGRLLVRASGTEPVIRVMAEGDDRAQIEAVVGTLCNVIEKAAQSA